MAAGSQRLVRASCAAAVLVVAVLLALGLSGVLAGPAHAAVARGIVDNRLEYHGAIDLGPVSEYAAEMGPDGLNAKWTRVFVYWDQLYPKGPWQKGYQGYDQTYLNELDTVVQALRDQDMQVILTGSHTPSWAHDTKYRKYWSRNASTAVVRTGDARVLKAFQGFAKFIAAHFAPLGVDHFEVWNEPNLRLQPQIVGKKVVGPEAYRKMLIAFSKGAHAGNRSAVVIAGATSRMGSNGTAAGSTSPQWFARYLKSRGAARWFNAYSHHPYSTRMSKPSPSAKPRRPDISVTLGNLPVLLKLFPKTPFYLTEYCYSTGATDAFVLSVSEADQARYLRQAYALVGTRAYRQVKVLLWFLVQDWQSNPSDPNSVGVYTGLVDTAGQRKPSWYAFAKGNTLSISAPGEAASRADFTIEGDLDTRFGPPAGEQLLLQSRGPSGGSWSTVARTNATDEGHYVFTTDQAASTAYRVVWDGVVESASRTVALQ